MTRRFKQSDVTTIPGIHYKPTPESLIALRNELPRHKDIYEKANKGDSFEECLAIIAAELRIVLDGLYDAAELCDLLVSELKRRHLIVLAGYEDATADPRLVPVRLVESKDTVKIENAGLIIPEGERARRIEEKLATSVKSSISREITASELNAAISGDDVWISCLLRLPEKIGFYEVRNELGTSWEEYWTGVRWEDAVTGSSITHWCEQPLPETVEEIFQQVSSKDMPCPTCSMTGKILLTDEYVECSYCKGTGLTPAIIPQEQKKLQEED